MTMTTSSYRIIWNSPLCYRAQSSNPQPSTMESHYHTPICITGYDHQTDIKLGHKCQTIRPTAYLGIREVFMKKCRQPGQEDIETVVGAIVGHKQCPGKNNNKNTNKNWQQILRLLTLFNAVTHHMPVLGSQAPVKNSHTALITKTFLSA